MPIKVNDINYLTKSEVLAEVQVTRQTLWRWGQRDDFPKGHRLRNRQVVYAPEEVETIRDFANQIRPIDDEEHVQLGLFNGINMEEIAE